MSFLATPLVPNAYRLTTREHLYLIDTESLPFLLDARNIRIATLNSLGRAALPGLLSQGLESTAKSLACQFGVATPQVRRDLHSFQATLRQQQLLPGSRDHRGGYSWSAPFASGLRRLGRLRLPRRGTISDEALRPAVSMLLRQAWLDLRVRGWAGTLQAWNVRRYPIRPRPADVASL